MTTSLLERAYDFLVHDEACASFRDDGPGECDCIVREIRAALAAEPVQDTGTDTREALRELLEHAQASLRGQPDRLQPDVREAAKSIEVALNTLPRLAATPPQDTGGEGDDARRADLRKRAATAVLHARGFPGTPNIGVNDAIAFADAALSVLAPASSAGEGRAPRERAVELVETRVSGGAYDGPYLHVERRLNAALDILAELLPAAPVETREDDRG